MHLRTRSRPVTVGKSLIYFYVIIAIGLGLRLLALEVFGPYRPHFADPYAYVQVAKSVDSGTGLVVNEPIYGAGLRAFYPPLYPILLALFGSIIGFSGAAILAMNSLIDFCTAHILKRQSLCAAAIFFLWPWNVLGSFVAQKESLACLIVVVLSELAIRFRDRLTPKSAALFGICSALLVLTQPGLILFPIAVAAFFFRRSPDLARSAAVLVCAGVAALIPWWMRNWLVFGSFVPLTSSGGLSLAEVVNQGHYPPPSELQPLPEPTRFARTGSLAAQHLVHHPLRYLHAVQEQVSNALFQEKFALTRVSSGPAPQCVVKFLAIFNWALLATAAWGRNRDAWLLFVAGIMALAPAIWLEFGERHRYFLLPFIALLAADALRSGMNLASERWKSKSLSQHRRS